MSSASVDRDHALLQVVALGGSRRSCPSIRAGRGNLVGTGVRVEPDHRKPEPGAEEREHDDSRNAEKARNSGGGQSSSAISVGTENNGVRQNAACTAA